MKLAGNRLFMRSLVLGAVAALWSLGGGAAEAQWQKVAGSRTCRDAGRATVLPINLNCTQGGYISVGETFSMGMSSNLCNPTSDIYVIRVDANGNILWAQQFDIGGNDSALAIAEVPGPGNASGFIITGVTDDNNYYCEYRRSIFVMKIGCGGGGAAWVNVYNDQQSTDLVGTSVTISKLPKLYGDIIIGGYRIRAGAFGGDRDAMLMRLDPVGFVKNVNFIDLNGLYANRDQYVNGVTEANNGDIIAVGTSSTPLNGKDGLFIRTLSDPRTVVTTKLYGGPGDEEFRGVENLTVGPDSTNIAIVGYTTTGRPKPITYVTKVGPNGNCVVDATISSTLPNPNDEGDGYAIKEVKSVIDASNGGIVGDLVLTGQAFWSSMGHGLDDAHLVRLSRNLNAIRFNKMYGGAGNDCGMGVAEDPTPGLGQLPGYIVAGYTESPLYDCNDPEQMYLIKTNSGGFSGFPFACFEDTGAAMLTPQNFCPIDVTFNSETFIARCPAGAIPTVPWAVWTPQCACVHLFPTKPGAPGEEIGDGEGSGALTLYPNPVRRGGSFTLEAPGKESRVAIAVSDIAGKVISTSGRSVTPTEREISVSTEGWSAGTYFVTITADGASRTARVVVTDK
jgi:hypothetical protein